MQIGKRVPGLKRSEFIEINPAVGPPQISILMPLYNQRDFAAEAVNSILSQTGVVAEIILSDDCSEDGTAHVAEQCVREAMRGGRLPHRVLFRRGSQRLWRDHLVMLSKEASCDILCQAHGDDVSAPHRAETILRAARAAPEVVMFVSRSRVIGRQEPETPSPAAPGSVVYIPADMVIAGSSFMFGFCQAWRRSRLALFGLLDTKAAVTAHDRIMAYRSFLAGGVLRIEENLVNRRIHSGAASHLLYFGEPRRLSIQLSALARSYVMKRDTELAFAAKLIDQKQKETLLEQLSEHESRVTAAMVAEYNILTRRGLAPVWQEDRHQ